MKMRTGFRRWRDTPFRVYIVVERGQIVSAQCGYMTWGDRGFDIPRRGSYPATAIAPPNPPPYRTQPGTPLPKVKWNDTLEARD